MKPENSFKLLGTLAIEKGWVTVQQIEEAIKHQVETPQKLGEILLRKGYLSKNQLDELLDHHTQMVFNEDERQFGRIAIKNKFISKEDLEIALKEQKGTNDLLGEVLVGKGLITLQKCNAILKSQERFLISIDKKEPDGLVSCPKCNMVYKVKDPDRPRTLRCNNCRMVFEMNISSNDNVEIEFPSNNLNNEEALSLGITVQNIYLKEDKKKSSSTVNDFSNLNSYLKENKIGFDENHEKTLSSRFLSEERYNIGKEIDRGGMGLILATKDLNIQREIVTKVLLSKNSKEKVLRFIREAQINGQLEHPNIVPVHDLGMNLKGQIYFTMKWVKGETLRSILQNLDRGDFNYRQKYTCQALIEIVKKVCDALEYAHSKKIIHRDLKPDNIMVGEFGEVQLMDWGLAKELGVKERFVEALEESNPINKEADLSKTVVGTCIGTPEYMSPEQANGDIENMDERTDIYGLGGVLHSCLSLTTPVRGNSFENVLSKVTTGRLNALPKNTPPELVAIIKKAMALKPDDRYQSIAELSADLSAFQSGFAVSVKHDSFFEALNKLIKRNKAISIGSIISILALMIGLVVSTRQWKEAIKQKKLAETNFSLAMENEKKIQLEIESGRINLEKQKKQQLKEKIELATESVKRGREFLSQANATDHKFSSINAIEKNNDLYNAANSFRQALIYNNENEDANRGLYETGKKHFELSLWLQSFEQAESNLSDIEVAGGSKAEITEFQKKIELAKNEKGKKIRERVKLLMDDAKSSNRKIIHEAASKELISLKNKLTVELLKEFIDSSDFNCQKLAIDSLAWMDDQTVSLKMLPFIHKIRPNGKVNPQEIQVSSIMAISILKPSDLSIYNKVRGRIWEESNNINSQLFSQIKLFYEPYAALMAEKEVASLKDIKESDDWLVQGVKFHEGQEFQKAIECFNKAIEFNPNYAMAYSNRGITKSVMRDYESALLDLEKANELSPSDYAYNNLGSIKMNLNRIDEGIEAYTQAINLNPNNIEAYNNRGVAKRQKGDFEGALADYDTVIKMKPEYIKSYVNRGIVKNNMGDFNGAILDYDKALQLNANLAEAYGNRANSKFSLQDIEGCMLDFNKAIELDPLFEKHYYNRGNAKEMLGDYEGALSDFNKVISINPYFEFAYFKRASQKINTGDYIGAYDDFCESIKIRPNSWESWYGKAIMAHSLKREDSFKEAREKVKSLHNNPEATDKKLIEECEKALVQYEYMINENKKLNLPEEYFKRAEFWYFRKKYIQAEKDYSEAIKLDTSFSDKCYVKMLTIAFILHDDHKKAKYYEQWIKYNPNNSDVKNDYAWFLVSVENKEIKNLSLGLTYAISAAELTEFKSYSHLDTLAYVYFKNSKFEEAVKYAKKVLELMPNNSTVEYRQEFEKKLKEYNQALLNQNKK